MKATLFVAAAAAVSIFIAPHLRAEDDAKIAADNIEYSRDFYAGVHFSAIATLPASFAYDRYPDNGPERIRCDQGTFARKHGKPWLKSNDWGETGQAANKEMVRKIDGWIKLIEVAFNPPPADIKLINKSQEDGRAQWFFEAHSQNPKGLATKLRFAKPLYDKNESVLLHAFDGSMKLEGDKVVPAGAANPVKLSFGYLITVNGGEFELSERAWEDLEAPKTPENIEPKIGPKPQDADGLTSRGIARAANGDLNGGIADFTHAIDLDPKHTLAVYNRGLMKLQKGDLDAAIVDLNRAIELSPKTADYYNDRGLAKLRKRDNDAAIADFTRSIELDPKAAQIAYRNRALARNIKKDFDGAIDDYNHAIELDPKNANSYNSRGIVKKAKGDLDGAITDFSKAIEINPKLTVAYKNRSEAKQAKGDTAGAKADSEQAEGHSPESDNDVSEADLVNRGINKGKAGDLDGALADFNRAVELDPKDSVAYYNRAYAKRLKKDPTGAIADYTKAIELDPKYADAYYNRGNTKADANDLSGAIADYNRAIEINPKYSHAYYNRGVARREKGDTAAADADFKRAGDIDPELASPAINTVTLLDGKFKIDIPSDFKREPDDPKEPKTLAKFAHNGEGGAWGTVLRGTHGLTPQELDGYMKKRVAEYSKGFKWMPKDAHLQWLHKEIVTINGWKWADWSFVPVLKGKKDYRNNPIYTRNLTTSYKGQLLEINFTTNLTTDPALKDEIDKIVASVHLEE